MRAHDEFQGSVGYAVARSRWGQVEALAAKDYDPPRDLADPLAGVRQCGVHAPGVGHAHCAGRFYM